MNVIKILKKCKGWVSRLMDQHKKAKNSCCLLLKGKHTAQGILCRIITKEDEIGRRFGLLTCHHVIPSEAETLGWAIYYGEGEYLPLHPLMIDNFYSCCYNESGNKHFDKECPVALDFTLIEFIKEAPIPRDIELLYLDYTQDLDFNSIVWEGQCHIYQRQQNTLALVSHEDHKYAFDWEGDLGNVDWSNFSILTPKQIKGRGTSGCPVVSFPTDDGSPHLLGMHTCTVDYKGKPVSGNASIVGIIKLLSIQKKVVNQDLIDFLEFLECYFNEPSRSFDNLILWMMANRLCKLDKDVKSFDEITRFCKCMSNCSFGFTITLYL